MALSKQQVLNIVTVGSFIAVIVLMNVTDPTKNVASILLVFFLLYVLFVSFIYSFLGLVRGIVARQNMGNRALRSLLSTSRTYYIASALGFVPVCLMAMQSLNQVKLLDLMLVIFLTCLVIFYIIKRTE